MTKQIKNSCFLSIFFICISTQGYAQQWAPKGATWYYSVSIYGSDGFVKIKYVGDTLIGSHICKTLKKTLFFRRVGSTEIETHDMGLEYTYSTAKKVYYFRYGKFYKLYDFDAKARTSWKIAGNIPGCDSTSVVKIDSVGYTLINKKSLKYIWVKAKNSTNSDWNFSQKIIPTIGGLKYMFPQQNCNQMAVEFSIGPLRCYTDSVGGHYDSGKVPACDYIPKID